MRRVAALVLSFVALLPNDTRAQQPSASARYALASRYSNEHAGDALVIWENGRVVFEDYEHGFHKGDTHRLNSGSKTFNGLMAIAAVEDGLITLDEPVSNTITEWKSDPQKSRITIRELLHLTSGLDTHSLQTLSYDEAIHTKLVAEPGAEFRYGSTGFQVFGALLQRKLGTEPVTSYLQLRVLGRIGAHVAKWDTGRRTRDPQLAAGAWMTADDWLRVGLMMLGRGTLDGAAVIQPNDFAMLTQPTASSPAYGLTTWLNAPVAPDDKFLTELPDGVSCDGARGCIYDGGPSDLYMAAGLFNQRLYVIPSRQMVIVRFGRMDFGWDDGDFLARALDGVARPAKKREGLLARWRAKRREANEEEGP